MPYGIIVWGIITQDLNLLNELEKALIAEFDSIILQSSIIPFNFTDYYEKEFGKNLKRLWLVTEKIVTADKLIALKSYAQKIERKFLDQNQQRRINLDPGLLTLSNFILTTTKNYCHRIYLGNGIFAEVTLIYQNKSFQALPWTYPDYRQNIEFFNEVRNKLHQQLMAKKIL